MVGTMHAAVLAILILCSLDATVAVSIGNKLSANFFAMADMPLNESAAIASGWVQVAASSTHCNPLYGRRYRRLPRLSPTMLYDDAGQVAGMQFAFNTTNGFPVHPGSSMISPPYFPPSEANAESKGIWTITMHFSDPSTICNSPPPLGPNSVGDRLWTRVSEKNNEPESFYALPLTRESINPEDGWVRGGCLPSGAIPQLSMNGMGQHYWRNFHPRMPLSSGYPWFVIYDQTNVITMFGITIGGPFSLYPTQSGKMDNTWRTERVPVQGPNKFFYPKAETAELWTYPSQPLIPFFHVHSYMPEELLFLNLEDETLPCGTYSTSTMHIVLRDADNIDESACIYDHADPRNRRNQSAADVRASYGQPSSKAYEPGVWSLQHQCDMEITAATRALEQDDGSDDDESSDGDSKDDEIDRREDVKWGVIGGVVGFGVGFNLFAAWSIFRARRKQPRNTMLEERL